MTSVFIRNFGCRVNLAEAFAWAEAFEERGLRLAEDWAESDLVLVNTCTLTDRADRDVRRFIRRVARARPGLGLVVTGCLAERAPEEFAGRPGVRLVVPNAEKTGLAERVLALTGAGPATEPARFRARALLKVQDGCDRRCAFCVIPSVRGRARSLPVEEAAAATRRLADGGYREIVLAGIHLSSYGRDLEPRGSLEALLDALEPAAPGVRFRLSSLDPRDLTPASAARLASRPGVRPHFHLSLQHVSGTVLEKMGRPIPEGFAREVLDAVRGASPDAALGADFIVGFPGETEEDFRTLCDFFGEAPLTYAHVFPFSPREGTPAAGLTPVREDVRARRADALRRLAADKNRLFRASFVGRTLDGVVVGRRGDAAAVVTANFLKALVPACGTPRRETTRVRIVGLTAGGVRGVAA
jgi:threonylcarbamoyladenosine tRNA methylthiotransferase MtaB